MGNKITLDLEERTVFGKKVAKLRADGLVPAVVYGDSIEPIAVQAPQNVMEKIVRDAGTHTPVHLTVGSVKKMAMIKDADKDPVKGTIRHISFHAVKQNESVLAEVPINLIGQGESEAEKAGLIVLQSLEKIEVKAFPMDLPAALEVSVASLKEAGEHLKVSDIKLPANVELVDNMAASGVEGAEGHSVSELVVASVYEPSSLAAANESAGGDSDGDVDSVPADSGGDTLQGEQAGAEAKKS